MKSAPKTSGRLEIKDISERRVTPTGPVKTTADAERIEKINELFKAIGDARATYYASVSTVRKTVAPGAEYTDAYQEWAVKTQAAARERDDGKRAALKAEAEEALSLAKKLQTMMDHAAAFQAKAERKMKREIAEYEQAILDLGGVLDLTAEHKEAGDD